MSLKSRRERAIVTFAVLALVLALAGPAVASAATIRTTLTPSWMSIWNATPHVKTALVRVYGPGYYRDWRSPSRYVSLWLPNTAFTNAPTGNYRVSCDWYDGYGRWMSQDNRYFWASSTAYADFRSPR
jgi:hypothetical protein